MTNDPLEILTNHTRERFYSWLSEIAADMALTIAKNPTDEPTLDAIVEEVGGMPKPVALYLTSIIVHTLDSKNIDTSPFLLAMAPAAVEHAPAHILGTIN